MRFARLALGAGAAFAVTVTLTGQAVLPPAPMPLQTSAKQHVMGGITVESSATGQARIQLWINTAHWKAYPAILEADKFTVRSAADGSQLIESRGAVRLSGFTVGRGDIDKTPFLVDAEGKTLTWDRGFKLQIGADGTPQWFCCPR